MGSKMFSAAATKPVISRSRPSFLTHIVLAAGLMLFPNHAIAQGQPQKPAEAQTQGRRQLNVMIKAGDIMTSRLGKCTYQLRIRKINRKDMEFVATAREVEVRNEEGKKREYIREAKVETSVEYGQAWKWGGAVLQAEGKGNGTAMLGIECEEGCPQLKKAAPKKTTGKGKKVKEGSI